ncbi:MAG: cell envelope integrity protein CreD [Treponema sp.]|jgi:inner membrane protein|nr:cell envelope integrity protein CreD [Treponema sp.]
MDKQPSFKKISQGYTFKVLMLVALVLLLLLPLNMIRGLVRERGRTAAFAEADIMEAWGNQLIEAGPVVIIPGVQTTEHRSKTEKDGEKVDITKQPFTLMVSPKKLNIDASFKTEVRKRGIFSVPLFQGTLALSGSFDPAMAVSELRPNEEVFFNQAELVIALSSQKGIRKINKSEWDGGELFFQPGNRGYNLFNPGDVPLNADKRAAMRDAESFTDKYGGGIYAALPRFQNKEAEFSISMEIQGGQLVRVLPIGQDTSVRISSDWPSPSFQGAFLPSASSVSNSEFSARWDISYLSRDIPLFQKDYSKDRYNYGGSLFGVDFFRTIDTYALNTRAVKYAILFLMVPFLTLFLLEVFTKKRIHPVPYLLSGIGNAVFYLLLLSLSEQIPFDTAYLIAAFAVTALMTLYSRSLLPSWGKSWYMGLVVGISYVLLYAVLNAESYALLIGSVGAFVIIALVMFLTRKLDWYGGE